MPERSFSASALIPAPPSIAYAVIADYLDGHPRILPKPPFVSLDVESGGIGAGTVLRVKMRVLGRLQEFGSVVSEPEPGRVLVETNDTGYVSTFTVEPHEDGGSVVTIATAMPRRGGVLGRLELRLVRRLLVPVYARELALLARVAEERRRGP